MMRAMAADEFKELLEKAFVSARDSGKRGWNRMTIAVLKNRLLQLTNRTFTESTFGAKSLLELLSRYSELISIDRSTRPPTVEWLDCAAVAPEPIRPGRVRADLWRAVLDYTSGTQFEWDMAHAQARAVPVADPARSLPTINAAILGAWRKSFADDHAATLTEADDKERVQGWVEKGLGTQHLPRRLQSAWNAYLKNQVIERLEQWFGTAKVPVPKLTAESREGLPVATTSTALRQFVHRCIDTMSDDELEALVLPAGVVFRTRGE